MNTQNPSSNDILTPLKKSDFPHIQIVQASAGSGKTYTLTQRVVQFLLSQSILNNEINNIMAITFTKNATNDIKNKVLEWVKKIYLDQLSKEEKKQIIQLIGTDNKDLTSLASKSIEEILNNYSDLVLTIDSFITKIIRSSAIELGLNPDFEVDVSSNSIIDYAFDEFLESVSDSDLRKFLIFLNEYSNQNIDFQVVKSIKKKLNYLLDQESSHKSFFIFDEQIINKLKLELEPILDEMLNLLEQYSAQKIRGNTGPAKISSLKNALKEKNVLSVLANKIKFPYKDKLAELQWKGCFEEINSKLYTIARTKNFPYLKLFVEFKKHIVKTYNILGKTFLPDVNKRIVNLLEKGYVPTIYFTLGSYIYHYLIDEFQDTSKMQWEILKPLIEESLSKGGSLFIVGDLKQSIYGFRKADFEIMKNLIEHTEKIFPQSRCISRSLNYNYRSFEHIVNYSKKVFKEYLKDIINETNDPTHYLDFEAIPLNEHLSKGYVKTQLFNFENDEGINCIKESLLKTIDDLLKNGYKLEQIAILAHTNEEINTISGWLLEKNYTVLSQSASDIRQRKIINEIMQLLKFFNNPLDNLSLAAFLLGDVFNFFLKRDKIINFLLENRSNKILYINFKNTFKDTWDTFFKDTFNSIDHIPVYELLLNIIKRFKIDENFQQESHYLSFLLDKILELEQSGINDMGSFIEYFENNAQGESNLFSCEFSKAQEGIQLLTIHKSKGLQFDVVINILNADKNYALNPNKKSGKQNEFVFENENENSLDYLFIKKDFLANDTLNSVYSNALLKGNIENFNILYVALTRAKMQMYNFIYYKQTDKPQCPIIEEEVGTKLSSFSKELTADANRNFVRFSVSYNKLLTQSPAWTIKRIKDSKKGEIYHKLLAHLKYEEDFLKLDELVLKYTKFIESDADRIKQQILHILNVDELKKLFDKSNKVFTEKTFIDKNGKIFRMDRVVIDSNGYITVLDYKTGNFTAQEIAEYKSQVLNYINILKDFFDSDNVFGIIYNINTKGVIKVEQGLFD
ncbi:ATP-dependent DNA helicase UvrD/PcrA [Desulfurella amilsii]|uniref:DNA 3'-5' helicase n=1 Tax=Desulfurella amilsii TaxID=1562698 RepID=A0A1X4XV22_9BACT|nr:UvrD-helicase domain-containing protein [Desulfurella amilsii]OSS41387.1 ATP-dependent DNA helicase UvrD/PcrA [Desulfurella amilsii]